MTKDCIGPNLDTDNPFMCPLCETGLAYKQKAILNGVVYLACLTCGIVEVKTVGPVRIEGKRIQHITTVKE